MKTIRHIPMRKEEFTKDQWYDIARRQEPGLTRAAFDAKWPRFCQFLGLLQNAEIIECKLNG